MPTTTIVIKLLISKILFFEHDSSINIVPGNPT